MIADLRSWMDEITQARDLTKRRLTQVNTLGFVDLIHSLGFSKRQCMDPADYVYGVLGMLQIKIPRLKNHNVVWTRFLYELENFVNTLPEIPLASIVISESAHSLDICEAKTMSDVYNGMFTVRLAARHKVHEQ